MEKRTVKWYMEAKKMIAFENDDEAYFLEDKVVKFLGENIPEEGQVFEVEFGKDDEGEVTVSKLKLGGAKQEETKTTTETKEEVSQPQTTTDEKLLTVGGVSYKNLGITFEQEKDVWYDFKESDVKGTGIKRGVSVYVVAVPQQGKKNKLITSIRIAEEKKTEVNKEEPKTETKTNNTYKKSSNNSVQDSIEAQAAVNSASNLVATLFAGKFETNETEKLTELINTIAKNNFQTVQNLKNL